MILDLIKKIIKRKKQTIIFDIYLKDFSSSNYYIALVYNNKIKKYRVLYVPIDLVDSKLNLEEYFCYQFIYLHNVNTIIDTLMRFEERYEKDDFRLKSNPNMESNYIEMSAHFDKKDYLFTFSQYLNKEFVFFYDLIVLLFLHVPKDLSDVCDLLLAEFKDNVEAVRYNATYDFDIKNPLKSLFSQKVIRRHKYSFDDISFIEKIGYRYYMILNDEIFIIDYDEFKYQLNISCLNYDSLGDEVYIFVKAIQNKIEKKLNRIKVVNNTYDFENENSDANYYLCYGISGDNLKIINDSTDNLLEMELLKKKLVKFEFYNPEFREEIVEYFNDFYEKDRFNEIIDFLFR